MLNDDDSESGEEKWDDGDRFHKSKKGKNERINTKFKSFIKKE